jgi:VWFA-related protein
MKFLVLYLTLFFAFALNVSGQNQCLAEEEAKRVIESIQRAAPVAENKKLRRELIEMREEREKLNEKISQNFEKNQSLVPEANLMGERHLLRVCRMIKEHGFLTRESLKDDGFEAFTFVIANNKAYQFQKELLPVLVEAGKKGYIGNPLLAGLVDNIRVGAGLPQIFGTSATVRNEIIYLYPLLNEEKVDDWRKMYGLAPLTAQIRALERRYLLPLLKMPRPPAAPKAKQKGTDKNSDISVLGITDDESAVLQVETRLVSLNVRVLTQDLKPAGDLNLAREDFTILEDGVEQDIEFFSTTEKPFDLVLLLDFSGSTFGKRDLIKKAAARFVDYARPADRIAVAAFADEIKIISNLTDDKTALAKSIEEIEMDGGSAIWDSLKFIYENIIKKESAGRRSAIIFMTDGDDYSMETTFADSMEMVRRGDTTIFPVYIDNKSSSRASERYWLKSRKSLLMLAEETGGQFYQAKDLKDLNGIYEQVINDLGKVYSMGYEPKNEVRDGGWRNLIVKIKTRPDLIARTRRGYYAR